jgi:hypothetical protein
VGVKEVSEGMREWAAAFGERMDAQDAAHGALRVESEEQGVQQAALEKVQLLCFHLVTLCLFCPLKCFV